MKGNPRFHRSEYSPFRNARTGMITGAGIGAITTLALFAIPESRPDSLEELLAMGKFSLAYTTLSILGAGATGYVNEKIVEPAYQAWSSWLYNKYTKE